MQLSHSIIPLYTFVYPCIPWYTLVYPCIPWYTLVYPPKPLYTHVYLCIPPYTLVYLSIRTFSVTIYTLCTGSPCLSLRADFWNYQKSGVSREISNSFIFCPYNLYSGVLSKITLKVSSACYFLRNRAKFEIRQISVLLVTKLTKNYPFSSRS